MGTSFRYRDFLFPERLLQATGSDTNPLVAYSERRHGRPLRFAGRVLAEILLIFGMALFVDAKFESPLVQLLFFGPGVPAPIYLILLPWVFPFFLIRYLLYINDQSHHTKTLHREQLEHLLLTRLTGADFYLHHLLLFCLRYRPIVWCLAITAVPIAIEIFTGYRWIMPHWYTPLFHLPAVVLLSWAAAVMQYMWEWNAYAGGRLHAWRPVVSWLRSALIAVGVTVLAAIPLGAAAFFSPRPRWGGGYNRLSSLPFEEIHGAVAAIVVLAVLFVAATKFIHARAVHGVQRALPLLWHRFAPDEAAAPDPPGALSALALLYVRPSKLLSLLPGQASPARITGIQCAAVVVYAALIYTLAGLLHFAVVWSQSEWAIWPWYLSPFEIATCVFLALVYVRSSENGLSGRPLAALRIIAQAMPLLLAGVVFQLAVMLFRPYLIALAGIMGIERVSPWQISTFSGISLTVLSLLQESFKVVALAMAIALLSDRARGTAFHRFRVASALLIAVAARLGLDLLPQVLISWLYDVLRWNPVGAAAVSGIAWCTPLLLSLGLFAVVWQLILMRIATDSHQLGRQNSDVSDGTETENRAA